MYETSQLGSIALHIFRVWHGTIRCNRCSSEPLLLVDCCVLCSVITVSMAFITRLLVGPALWLVFRLGRHYGSSFVWDGVHRSSPLCFRHSVLRLSRDGVHHSSLFDWILHSSLNPFRFRLGMLCACIGRCRHLVGRWIMLLFSCMHAL